MSDSQKSYSFEQLGSMTARIDIRLSSTGTYRALYYEAYLILHQAVQDTYMGLHPQVHVTYTDGLLVELMATHLTRLEKTLGISPPYTPQIPGTAPGR